MIRRIVLVMLVVGVFASGSTAVAQTGACCYADGFCEILTEAECDDPNVAGAYQGDGVTCEDANCDERCDPECDWCWFDTIAENNCPDDPNDMSWNGTNDGCDCGCQFEDPDCDSTDLDGACCFGDGSCEVLTETECVDQEGAYQGDGVTCEAANCDERCDPECDYCWVDTSVENNCPDDWNGTDDGCDCGCQFDDPDCGTVDGSTGACCFADGFCETLTEDECYDEVGAYQGDGVTCAEADCEGRCPSGCDWCWSDTIAENNCPDDWNGTDDGCDCGCQFDDPDCDGISPDDATGACCFANEWCDELTESECQSLGGSYQGDGTRCGLVDCGSSEPFEFPPTCAPNPCGPGLLGAVPLSLLGLGATKFGLARRRRRGSKHRRF